MTENEKDVRPSKRIYERAKYFKNSPTDWDYIVSIMEFLDEQYAKICKLTGDIEILKTMLEQAEQHAKKDESKVEPPASSEFSITEYLEFEKLIHEIRDRFDCSIYHMAKIEEWFRSKGYRMTKHSLTAKKDNEIRCPICNTDHPNSICTGKHSSDPCDRTAEQPKENEVFDKKITSVIFNDGKGNKCIFVPENSKLPKQKSLSVKEIKEIILDVAFYSPRKPSGVTIKGDLDVIAKAIHNALEGGKGE